MRVAHDEFQNRPDFERGGTEPRRLAIGRRESGRKALPQGNPHLSSKSGQTTPPELEVGLAAASSLSGCGSRGGFPCPLEIENEFSYS